MTDLGGRAFDPGQGQVRLSPADIADLRAVLNAEDPREPDRDRLLALAELGVLGKGGIHPVMRQALEAIEHPRRRIRVVRTVGDDGSAIIVSVSPAAVVAVRDTEQSDNTVTDIAFAADVTGLARVLGRLVGIGPTTGQPPTAPSHPLTWDEATAPVIAEPPATCYLVEVGQGDSDEWHTAFVFLRFPDGAVVELAPVSDGPVIRYRWEPRPARHQWFELCTLIPPPDWRGR